jgi:hypothetical protein
MKVNVAHVANRSEIGAVEIKIEMLCEIFHYLRCLYVNYIKA